MLTILNGCDFCDEAEEPVVRFGGSGEGVRHYICRACVALIEAAFKESA